MWARNSTAQTLGAGAQFSQNLLAGFETDYGANLIGATVIRVRGQMTAQVTTAVGPVDEIRFGLRVSSATEASAVLGGPVDQPHADWMMWEPFLAGAVGVEGGAWTVAREIDVKSMRKMEEINQQLTMYVEAFNASAWEFGWSLSILLKLP